MVQIGGRGTRSHVRGRITHSRDRADAEGAQEGDADKLASWPDPHVHLCGVRVLIVDDEVDARRGLIPRTRPLQIGCRRRFAARWKNHEEKFVIFPD
jgi:hypothetical protein